MSCLTKVFGRTMGCSICLCINGKEESLKFSSGLTLMETQSKVSA